MQYFLRLSFSYLCGTLFVRFGEHHLNAEIVKTTLLLLLCLVTRSFCAQEMDESPIMTATKANNLAQLKKLVAAGESVKYDWTYGEDALSYAIEHDYREIAKYLLANGANSRYGLYYAVETNDLAWVKFLVGYGFTDDEAMIPAVEKNNLEMVNYLISENFPVDFDQKRKTGLFNKYYVTPLEIALGKNDAIVIALVKAGADMERAFSYCTNTNLKLGQQLIDLGSAVNEQYLWSLRDGDRALMNYALKKGADPNYTDEKGMNAYLHAVESENLAAMRYCVDTLKLPTNLTDSEGHTDLMLAAYDGNRDVLDFVLSRNPDLNAVDKYGQNALCHAMYFNNVETIELLLSKGVNLNNQDEKGYTVVVRAAEMGQEKVIECLLKHHPDLSLKTKTGKNILSFIYDDTPLDFALIQKLIAMGADPKATTSTGADFAYIAIDHCDLELLKKVKEMGLSVDGTDDRGRRAGCDDPEVIRYVIENGGDINRMDTWRKTWLDEALNHNNLELAAYLIGKGANVNGNYDGDEPILLKAVEKKNLAFVQLLVESGADLAIQNRWNENLMELANKAAASGSAEAIAVADYLKSKGALTREEFNNREKERSKEMQSFDTWIAGKNTGALLAFINKYKKPLMTVNQLNQMGQLAVQTSSLDLLQICLERYKMDINAAVNFEGQTLLHVAAKNNQKEMAVLLVNKGADVHKTDALGKLPLEYAKKKELKNYLKETMKSGN